MRMKKFKRKRLNNKGFTLIELLAVVVILAVVMGIAMTSVLSAMNKSRGGSLQDSAQSVVRSFNQAYTESLVGSSGPTEVLGKYNFVDSASYYIDESLADEFSMSTANYVLGNPDSTSTNLNVGITDNVATDLESSFVAYDSGTSKFLVCLMAKDTGSYFVKSYSVGANGNGSTVNFVHFGNVDYKFKSGTMFACYNGSEFTTTW